MLLIKSDFYFSRVFAAVCLGVLTVADFSRVFAGGAFTGACTSFFNSFAFGVDMV